MGIQGAIPTLPPAQLPVKCLRLDLTCFAGQRSQIRLRAALSPALLPHMATRGSQGSLQKATLPHCEAQGGVLHQWLFHPGFPKPGWNRDRVAADLPGRGGQYLKEPLSLSYVSVHPYQSAFLLNMKNTVTFFGPYKTQLQK